jgi:2-polyprenyl-6-methoxyphenol hydroxylase-like FAD-dependent oxidoreductase
MTKITTPVGIVGAGPVGLTLALDLAHRGVASTVLDAGHHEPTGSRAFALHRSALATWQPLRITAAILSEGIAWCRRRTYYQQQLLHTLELAPPELGALPTWINLPQSRLEELLIAAVSVSGLVDLRWRHRVVNFAQSDTSASLLASTDTGVAEPLHFQYVVAADGAHSTMRRLIGLPFPGRSYPDQLLITDIHAGVDWLAEPRIFFDHPAYPGAVLSVHPQPAGVWRIERQLHRNSEPGLIASLGRSQLDALFGDVAYEVVWSSVYRFEQRLLPQLEHGRILFAGDAAHLCAPFGARGLNAGIADVACLAPRLARVVSGDMAPGVLRSYTPRRMPALTRDQHESIAALRLLAPQTSYGRGRRKAILALAERWEFAQPWVHGGKMYTHDAGDMG